MRKRAWAGTFVGAAGVVAMALVLSQVWSPGPYPGRRPVRLVTASMAPPASSPAGAPSHPEALGLDALSGDLLEGLPGPASRPTSRARPIPAAVVPVAGPAPRLSTPPAPTGLTAGPVPAPPIVTDPDPSPSAAPPVTGTGTWAVEIGIDDYAPGIAPLSGAVNDADDVDQAMALMGVPADQRLVLRDGEASRVGVETALDWLDAHAGPRAVAVFFFAGHAQYLPSGAPALVAADGGDITSAQLAAQLGHLQAHRAWIALATCYAGAFTDVLAPGRVLTAAAPAGQLAYESSEWDRSYLDEYMVRQAMIEGRAPETVQSAFAYAAAALARQDPGRQPVEFDDGSGPLDLRQPGTTPAGSGAPAGAPAGPQPPPARPQASPARGPAGGPGGTDRCQALISVVHCSS